MCNVYAYVCRHVLSLKHTHAHMCVFKRASYSGKGGFTNDEHMNLNYSNKCKSNKGVGKMGTTNR